MKQEIEKEAREYAESYYPNEQYNNFMACLSAGFISGVNSKCAERIKIEYSDQECVSFADWKDKIDWNNYVEGIAQVVHKEIEHDGHIMTVRKSNSELLTIYKKENGK